VKQNPACRLDALMCAAARLRQVDTANRLVRLTGSDAVEQIANRFIMSETQKTLSQAASS
jgi:hypothetical protein